MVRETRLPSSVGLCEEEVKSLLYMRYPLLGPFGVWGRSMGAVTGLMGGLEKNELKVFVLDSPFSNLK